ncbi:serine/threonine-protein kinase Nek4-like [Esox lucius]|uniref:non-specific serine/threonine protein kinase n=1 Tax=Esox lucius TaxID=8010 RepID=A0AAY5KGX6_ESOLU|nr:serine/threonine-protein kinase Nek4-like [Esox lucius]
MGKTQSVLEKKGYTIQKEIENGVIATNKDGDPFVIKEIKLETTDAEKIFSEIGPLLEINHPHIASYKNSFQDGNSYYVVMDHCEGGDLSQKIRDRMETGTPFSEEQIMDWLVEICMAIKCVHDKGLLHRDLRPQNIFLTQFGTICLGNFGRLTEISGKGSSKNAAYLGPETLNSEIYNTKSDIWSLGCVLYELCMLQSAFTAENRKKKILGGPYPSLPESFSPELRDLLCDIFQKDPSIRPSAGEILAKPFIISFLTKKSEKTVKGLQKNLDKLRDLADGLERVHQGTTIGSLTGGVIGAAGGITSIVGLILAPFTLGASLIVTGVGVGVAVAGGATAGVSNITNMVNQSTDRKAIKNIIKEFQEKMNSVVVSLTDIAEGLEMLSGSGSFDAESDNFLPRAGARVGRGLGAIPELVRLVQVASIGRVAAQAARVVRVAEVATGVFSAFFALDAKEIHNIRQAKAIEQSVNTSRLEVMDTDSTTGLNPEGEEPVPEPKPEVKSETMKFIQTIKQTADQLQESLNELSDVISFIPKIDD